MNFRKTAVYVTAFAMIFFVLGCNPKAKVKIGADKIHLETDEGTVEIDGGENGSVKVRSKNGDVDILVDGNKKEVKTETGDTKVVVSQTPDLENLGVPVYPGARAEGGTAVDKTGKDAGSTRTVALKTADPVSKVAEFYREHLKGANVMDMQDAHNAVLFMKEEGENITTVAVTREKDETETVIAISVVKKK